jgi:hypothetical protein
MSPVRRFFACSLLLTPLLHGPAGAENIVARAVGGDGNETQPAVYFAYESCEDECHVATLACSPGGSVVVTFADLEAKQAAKAMQVEERQIALKAGSKVFDYRLQSMQFVEMNGSWDLSASEFGSKAGEIGEAIRAAKTLVLTSGGKSVTLPVDQTVKSWAAKCA